VRTASAALAAALCLLGACGPVGTDASASPVPDAAAGEQVTLFTQDDVDEDIVRFGIPAAFPLPDGTVLVSYDLAAESAGDETPRRPRLAVLGADDVLEPLELPEVDGLQVSDDAKLLAVGPDGTAYFSDRTEPGGRLVARAPDNHWRAVPAQLTTEFAGPSTAAVGPGGQLYIEDDVGLQLVSADGSVDTVVRIDGLTGSADLGAPPLSATHPPVPAQDVVLSDVWGLAVGPDGTVFVSTRSEIVAIDADGSLLVSDSYQQLVADVDPPAVVAHHATVATNGLNASWDSHHDLLLRLLDPEALQSGPSLPDQLAAFGR